MRTDLARTPARRYSLVLALLQHSIAEKLGRAEGLLDVLPGSVVDGYPGQDHDALGNCAQLAEHRRGAVSLLDVAYGDQGVVDRFQKVLVDSHSGATEVGLLRSAADEEELALFLEAGENFGGLIRG